VDSVSITVTGRLGDSPAKGTTRSSTVWASFSLAVDVPSRNSGGDREYETRWYKVWVYGALAEHVASSLVKGDRVTVRADDLNCRAWTEDSPEHKARAQAELKAYDVAASMRFETLVTARAARSTGTPAGSPQPEQDPWADASQPTPPQQVPEVLAGVTR
jgi:single-stranded DNA-binding protein